MDLLCVAFECDERGVLATAGMPWTDEEVARAAGGDLSRTLSCVQELVRKGVAKRNKAGAIYSARLVRDESIRKTRQIAGAKGGEANSKQNMKQNRSSSSSASSSSSTAKKKTETKESGASAPANPDDVSTPKEKPVHVEFMDRWKAFYESNAGEPFKQDQRHFVIAAKLIKDHGIQAIVQKARTLGVLCQKRSAWFTKDGWASFTLETLSAQWNRIIPQAHKPDRQDEFESEMQKQEALRERRDSVLKE